MALRLQQLRGSALVRPALKARPASTSTDSSTSTSDQSSPGPRRYRLTVDAVSVRLYPRSLFWDPLPSALSWWSSPLSLIAGPRWPLGFGGAALRPGWLLEQVVLSGVLSPRPEGQKTQQEGSTPKGQELHTSAESEAKSTDQSQGKSKAQNPTAAGEATKPNTSASEDSNSRDSNSSPSHSGASDSDSPSGVTDSQSGVPTSTDSAFRMKTDVEGFSDDEVKVTVADGAVTVQAEQERTTDGGRLSRRVYRRVTLPPGVEEGQVTVRREGGAVIVEAPMPQ